MTDFSGKTFEGKTIVITGCGISGATARRFTALGSWVRPRSGGTACSCACDITDRAGVEQAVAAVEADLGPIHVLVNNAGWDVLKPFLATAPEDWRRLIDINLVGALHMHHVVRP